MKAIFSLLLAASLGSAFAQCASPYNPDSDGDGVIGSSDLMGLLTTFGNPFCGYDSLNVQTVSDTSAVIDEDTDIIVVEWFSPVDRNIILPSIEGAKVFIVFVDAPTDGSSDTPYINFVNEGVFVGAHVGNSVPITTNTVINVVHFNGRWYVSSPL